MHSNYKILHGEYSGFNWKLDSVEEENSQMFSE